VRLTSYAPAPLAPFVRFWSCEAPELPDVLERSLPNGTMTLYVNLGEDEIRWYDSNGDGQTHLSPGASLGGARTHHYAIDTREQRDIVGATFTPGGARPFFIEPADVLARDQTPLEALWGRTGATLRARLQGTRNAAERLRTLAAVLLERRVRPLERHTGVDFALAQLRDRPVGDVVESLGMSAPRFIKLFAEHVGLTPKKFARVQRFQRATAALDSGARHGFIDLALSCGYFDQAHFIRDFREFAGVTPSDYLGRRRERNHLRLD
jgi:AraC-like DNA-binding protein